MRKKTLDNEYISSFCLEMSLLMHAGIGTEDGLYLLEEDETDRRNKKMIRKLAETTAEGRPFSEAIREAGVFPSYVADMVQTGEQSGRLEQAFLSLSEYYERQTRISGQIRSALTYPLVLTGLMLIIIVVLLVKVLPIFEQVYSQLGGTMTGTAALLLRLGRGLGKSMPLLCILLAVVVAVGIVFGSSTFIRRSIIRRYQTIFGGVGIMRRLGEARFASAMSMGMMSGLNTEEAFRTAMLFQNTTKRTRQRYEECLKMLEMGEPLADCFKKNRILDASYCRILDLGAKSGTSDTAMEEIARRMDDNLQMAIEQKVGRIEPTIVIVTSILVGIILIAVMLPLIHIMSSIG